MNLNIKIDKISVQEAKNKVSDFLSSSGQYKIFTPNPEMYVLAQKDKKFLEVLNSADLNICDGAGLSWFYKTPRISGADFILDICELAVKSNKSIFLLGAGFSNDLVLERTKENLLKKFPGLKITGFDRGVNIKELGEHIVYDDRENKDLLEKINNSGAQILFVGFGMNKQEKWIVENLPQIPQVKIAMGVGGSFDFLSQNIRRAPCFIQKIGLEWLYRLIQEPRRLKRIWNATVVFIYKILF